jgi:hypothetical protein
MYTFVYYLFLATIGFAQRHSGGNVDSLPIAIANSSSWRPDANPFKLRDFLGQRRAHFRGRRGYIRFGLGFQSQHVGHVDEPERSAFFVDNR